MSDDLEALLRLIDKDAPQSWHPRAYTEARRLAPDALDDYLEDLYLDGLIERGQSSKEKGPGVVLTEKGRKLLADPEGLKSLREGKALNPEDRGGIVREMLRRASKPVVTRLLLWANIAVFGWGLYLASKRLLVGAFFGGALQANQQVLAIVHQTGAVQATDLLRGQWWRLLSNCFVHIGGFHLLLNMYALYLLGRQAEELWGCWRYVLIYVIAGLGGSCLAEAYAPGQIVDGNTIITLLGGASGAICGLFGAEAVWMGLNRKYLPRSMARRWRRAFFWNLILLVFISLFPGVSGWGHFGGAVFGAAAAILLHWQRFGPSPGRWLALAGVLALPWTGFALLDRARATNPIWQKLEAREFAALDLPRRTNAAVKRADAWYQQEFTPMLRRDGDKWKDRDPAKVKKVLADGASSLEELDRVEADLAAARRGYRSPDVLEMVDALLEYTRESKKLLGMAREWLSDKQHITAEDRAALKGQEDKVSGGAGSIRVTTSTGLSERSFRARSLLAGGGSGVLGGGDFGVDLEGQLRFLACRQVGVNDAPGGGLVQALGGLVVFRMQLVDRPCQRLLEALQLHLDVLLGNAVVPAPLVALTQVLFGTLRMRHRFTPVAYIPSIHRQNAYYKRSPGNDKCTMGISSAPPATPNASRIFLVCGNSD